MLTVSDAQILTIPVAVSFNSAYLLSASSKSLSAFSTVAKKHSAVLAMENALNLRQVKPVLSKNYKKNTIKIQVYNF